tara:strand:- start:581 stop:1837 length:1257 start_codon:yes stop_codon:yes gene_type:complete
MKILMTGDLHMGRGSSKFPELEPQTSIDCWHAIVQEAVERSVDLVLLSGDIVDRRNCYFESYMPLQTGIARLTDNGIMTIAVAGNHDFKVLPKLTENMNGEKFRLLGIGGVWEEFVFRCDSETLAVTGWSFPRSHVEISPLDSFPETKSSCDYHIAMVHGDLNATGSKYAPLSLRKMEELEEYHWLLGHVHKSELRSIKHDRWVLYPGSPQALDPGEPLHHGVWVWDTESQDDPKSVPMSSVCYQPLRINVSTCEDTDEILDYVISQIKTNAESLINESHQRMRAVNYRIEVVGECDDPAEVEESLRKQSRNDLPFKGVQAYIEHLRVNVLPRLDKDKLRTQKTVLARAFNLLEILESGNCDVEIKQLLDVIQKRCSQHGGRYHSIDDAYEPKPSAIVDIAKSQLAQIISDLRGQPDE